MLSHLLQIARSCLADSAFLLRADPATCSEPYPLSDAGLRFKGPVADKDVPASAPAYRGVLIIYQSSTDTRFLNCISFTKVHGANHDTALQVKMEDQFGHSLSLITLTLIGVITFDAKRGKLVRGIPSWLKASC